MLRIALVDCGRLTSSYADALPRVTSASVVAVVDTDQNAAARAADLFGAEQIAASLSQLQQTGSQAFDAVVVDGPVASPELVDLARAGKHLMTDLATTDDLTVDRLSQACQQSGACLMFGQPLRFQHALQVVQDRLVSGKLGTPGLLRVHCWERANDERATSEKLVTVLDLANWLFETIPDSIYAVAGSADNDYVQVHLGFPHGGMALICVLHLSPKGADPYESVTMIGSTGAAYADQHHNSQLLIGSERTTALATGEGSRALRVQLQEFVDACEQLRTPAVNHTDAKKARLVANAATQSLEAGQSAHLVGENYELG